MFSGASSLAHDHADMSEGEIMKVDKAVGKLTIKHGELKNLSMPGMTMVFKVQNPAMLDLVKQNKGATAGR
jgi:Cu/Ag efflux protein CusF